MFLVLFPWVSGDEWLQALPRALVSGFVKTEKMFQRRGNRKKTMEAAVVIAEEAVKVVVLSKRRRHRSLMEEEVRLRRSLIEMAARTTMNGEGSGGLDLGFRFNLVH
ncbi:unnamed protein product [Eruca vesicaria subsp. sativa]|uniref:Uncharacterized protein n=1 Tax=Eruca vesicaria subsp. sativa TaxID=29727 RepID=A0ABC8KCW6_ERUVS|nr:unnamed protein product [Eruca vesicaria subsp. sativa]